MIVPPDLSLSALNALGIKRGNGSQGPWLSESQVIRIPDRRKCQVIVFSELCFVSSEVPMRFPELRLCLSESEKLDLQFQSGPRASSKQGR